MDKCTNCKEDGMQVMSDICSACIRNPAFKDRFTVKVLEKCTHKNYSVEKVMDFTFNRCNVCGFQWKKE